MKNSGKQLAKPFSSGGGGHNFESQIQAMFVTLMLSRGYVSYLPRWPITEITLQGRRLKYQMDDVIVTVEDQKGGSSCKLAAQIRYTIHVTKQDRDFTEVMQAAWNDFNNMGIFNKAQDRLALITGPGSVIHDSSWLLQQAKYSRDPEDFRERVSQEDFSSIQNRKRYEAFQHQLKKANNGTEVSNEELHSFLNCFHLEGYDLGNETGGSMSLLFTLLSKAKGDPQYLWDRIVGVVQTRNQHGGTITLDSLPEDLRNAFDHTLPPIFVTFNLIVPPVSNDLDWNQHSSASDLVFANLLGSWNENNEADLEVIRQLTNKESIVWLQSIRETLQVRTSPIALRNGRWQVIDRRVLWQALGGRVFDNNLANLEEVAVSVLSERDPKFTLPTQDRYAAQVYGAVLKHSHELRKGLAESLALLGNQHSDLRHCSWPGPKTVAALAVRRIFQNADWVLWGSLDRLLPTLAEASPDEFLKSVENGLQLQPCPFDEFFLQEEQSLLGENLITGLLWALESLAWHEEYLVSVCIILGNLANRDPGGSWANRPANSLAGILHPNRPQTYASVRKQKVAVETLLQEFPEVAWRLIRQLSSPSREYPLPTHRPIWRASSLDNRRES